jgi:hypothetical protein
MSFFLTVVASVLVTATVVHASSSGSEPTFREASVAPSRILGVGLSIESCDANPSTAAQWTKFAKCATGNFTKVRKWGNKLDRCIKVLKVVDHADDLYGDPLEVPLDFRNDSGLGYGPGASVFQYFMAWKQLTGCPVR